MWGALQEAATIITLVLDKSGESHRKCPRCRGSGLLENSFTRLEKNGEHPNQPCWFCEGIGALPIAGLNGFVLARTTPCLKALDKHKQPCMEFLQFNHCRYGEETSKVTSAKLGVNLADLFFDFNTSPWINCTSLGCQQNELEKSKAKESIFQHCVSEPRLQPLSSFSNKEPLLRNGLLQRILNAPLVLSIVSNSHPNATLSSAPSSVSSLQPSAVLIMPVNQKAANIHPVHKLRGGFTMQHLSYMRKTSYCNMPSIDNQQPESEFSGIFVTKLQPQTASSVFSTKRRRRLRKARNCIRGKARREAQERAGRLVRSLKHKDEPDDADSYVQPDATSRSLQGLGADGEQFSPSGMIPRIACLTSVAVSRQSWLNQLIVDGFKALMPTITKVAR